MMNHITIAARATPKDGTPSAGVIDTKTYPNQLSPFSC